MYNNYALAGLKRTKCQRAMMKIQVIYIVWWEVKDCCKDQCKSNNFIFAFILLAVNYVKFCYRETRDDYIE